MRKLAFAILLIVSFSNLSFAQVDTGKKLLIIDMKHVNNKKKELYVIDGLIYKGDIRKIDTTLIADIAFLNNPGATIIYGSQAMNGTVLITTKKERVHIDSLDKTRNTSSKLKLSDVLIIIDGQVYKGDVNAINPNDIASITILKGNNATESYDPEAKNGVLIISMKHNIKTDTAKVDTTGKRLRQGGIKIKLQ
jgi:TonB-dependent Receptor Plug Domain